MGIKNGTNDGTFLINKLMIKKLIITRVAK